MEPGMTKRARAGRSTPALAADALGWFECPAGHRTPFYGGPIRVTNCREYIGLRMRCGQVARVVE